MRKVYRYRGIDKSRRIGHDFGIMFMDITNCFAHLFTRADFRKGIFLEINWRRKCNLLHSVQFEYVLSVVRTDSDDQAG